MCPDKPTADRPDVALHEEKRWVVAFAARQWKISRGLGPRPQIDRGTTLYPTWHHRDPVEVADADLDIRLPFGLASIPGGHCSRA